MSGNASLQLRAQAFQLLAVDDVMREQNDVADFIFRKQTLRFFIDLRSWKTRHDQLADFFS